MTLSPQGDNHSLCGKRDSSPVHPGSRPHPFPRSGFAAPATPAGRLTNPERGHTRTWDRCVR